jgi:hypothetical protein
LWLEIARDDGGVHIACSFLVREYTADLLVIHMSCQIIPPLSPLGHMKTFLPVAHSLSLFFRVSPAQAAIPAGISYRSVESVLTTEPVAAGCLTLISNYGQTTISTSHLSLNCQRMSHCKRHISMTSIQNSDYNFDLLPEEAEELYPVPLSKSCELP